MCEYHTAMKNYISLLCCFQWEIKVTFLIQKPQLQPSTHNSLLFMSSKD